MLPIKNTTKRYGIVGMSLHWGMSVLILAMLAVGLYMTGLPASPLRFKLYGWHKEFGILILMLVAIRLGWRLSGVIPPLDGLPWWQKLAAHGSHLALYGFMFAMPITGWLTSSAAGFQVSFFGLFLLPDFIGPNEHWRVLLSQTHEWLGYGLIATICAHVGAALHHHFFVKDDILRRMLP